MSRAQVVVVGGGPAGLCAAITAAQAGAGVVLFDEQDALGGELRHRVWLHHLPGEPEALHPARLRAALVERATAVGVDLCPGCLVWGAFDGPVLGVTTPAGASEVVPERVVLATGSTDLALPFPGGTLPGVWSARAVQILVNRHRLLPGRRFAVVGGAGEGAEVAADIRQAGGVVVVVAGAGAVVAAEGGDGVRAVVVDGESFAVDVVVVAAGRQPDLGLAQMAGCPVAVDQELGGWFPVVDERMRAGDSPWFVAGNAAGACDLAVAASEGRLAGIAAAESLGLVEPAAVEAALAKRLPAVVGRAAARRAAAPRFVQAFQWEQP